ncbi:MAG TPA: hypothetical protein VK821_14095 [Dehalococcoidia bacterium]|nr:hypothetical protein [Dehalococcoidia bacterium]
MRKTLALVVAAIAVTAGGACTRPGQVTLQTTRLLPSLFGFEPQLPLGIGSEPVAKSTLDVGARYPGATIQLYRPAAGRHSALVISLGIAPAPPDDPRVVRLLTGLAQSGVVAALVDSPDLDASRLTPATPGLLVSAFQLVSDQPSVMPDHVGLLGLSVGGSLALIAAADPRIAGDIRLVEAVGAYDMARHATMISLRTSGQLVSTLSMCAWLALPHRPRPLDSDEE